MAGPKGKFDWNQFPTDKAPAADAKGGGKPTKFDWNQFEPEGPTETESGLRGVASGVTAGFDDEIVGALGGAGRLAGIKNLGSWKPLDPESHLETTDEPLTMDAVTHAYRENRDAARADQKLDMATNPKATIAGTVAGAVLSPVNKLKAGQKVFGPMSKLGTVTQAAKTAAMQGAVYGAGGSDADLTQGEVGKFAKDVGTATAISGAVPFALDGVGKAASKAKDLAQWAGTKALSNIGGVAPDVIKEYVTYSDRINAAPSVEKLKEVADEFVGKLASDVDAKKLNADQAKEALQAFQGDLKDAYRTAGYEANEAVTSAKQTLQDAHNSRIQQLSDDIYGSVNKLKGEVQKKSGEALETLKDSDSKIDLSKVYGSIDQSIDSLKKEGTDEALGVIQKLQDYKSRLMNENWANVSAPDAKRLIQGIDKITEYNHNAGTFDKVKNAAFKGIRSSLDESLKSTVPEYADAMLPVSERANLLGRVSDFGDRQTAASLLKRLESPNQMEKRAALEELGKLHGVDYVNAAKPENLPEYSFLAKAEEAKDALRPDRVAEKIDQTVSSSRQKGQFDAAKQALEDATGKLNPFKPLAPNVAGQTQTQQKLMQLAQGKNIEVESMFKELGKLTDTDFVQAMKDQRVRAAFEKGATNGSRNTLIGSIVGFALGGGTPGMVAGGATGRAMDQWGPAVTKKVLDAAIQVSKSPTAETIASLNIPEPIKRNMLAGIEGMMAKESASSESGVLRKVAGQKRGEDAWADKGADKLGITDPAVKASLLSSREMKRLLIEASDLAPGSKALQRIQEQISKELRGKNESTTSAAPTLPGLKREPASGR